MEKMTMRNFPLKQRGASFSGVILMMGILSLALTIVLKMGPSYFKYWQVKSAMEAVQERPDALAGGPRGIIDAITKQLYIDEVRSVTSKDFKVKNSKDGRNFDITVVYEEKKHIGFNVDVLMTFEHTESIPKPKR
jgi:hypothetical protein